MNNYGTPPLALVRGSGAEVWDDDGRRYLDLVAGIAVNALGHAHPAVVEAVTDADRARSGHTSNLFITEPPLALAERLQELLGRPTRGCCSATPAPRPTRPRSRSPGAPAARTSSPRENAFHGRTMGALALTGQPAEAGAVRAAAAGVSHVPTATSPRWTPPSTRDTAAVVPGADPRRGRRRSSRRRATCAAARRDHRRARRAAGARRGADRHRPHRRLVRPPAASASCRTSSRWPRASAAGCRSGRASASGAAASCSSPASTAPRSAATRSAAPPRWPCCDTIAADGLLEHVALVGKEHRHRHRGARAPAGRRRQRRRPADRRRARRSRSSAAGRRGRPGRRVPGQQRRAGPGPARPAAGAHRGRRPREFLDALPADPGPGQGQLMVRAPPARRRPDARPSRPRSSTSPTALKADRFGHAPAGGPAGGGGAVRQGLAPAPGCRSRSASPSSAAPR